MTAAVGSRWAGQSWGQYWVRSLMLLLVFVFVILQALGISADLQARRLAYEDYFRLRGDMRVNKAWDQAAGLGLEAEDLFVKVNGQSVPTYMSFRRELDQFEAGTSVRVTVERAGNLVDLTMPVVNKPRNLAFVARNLVGLAFVVFMAMGAFIRPDNRAARLCFLTGWAVGLYLALQGTSFEELVYVQMLALTLAPALVLHFFLSFPRDRLSDGALPWLLYVPSLVLLGLTWWTYARAMADGLGPYRSAEFLTISTKVDFGFLLLSILFGLVSLLVVYRDAQGIHKRQLQWIMWGTGCVAVVGLTDVVMSTFNLHTMDRFGVLLLAMLPLPLAFGMATVRYRLWDTEFVIKRSVVYALLTAFLIAVYLVITGVLSNALGAQTGSDYYGLVLFLSAIVVGLLVQPLRAQIQSVIDRVFFRQQLDYQRASARWSEKLSTSLRFADLTHLLLHHVPSQLLVDRAWLLALNLEETSLDVLDATDPPAGGGQSALDLSILVSSPLALRLRQPGQILVLPHSDDEEAWDPNTIASPSWKLVGVRVVLPLVSADRLVGVYLLGNKLSGDIYQRQELDLLRTLANQAAVAIANARLYEEVHSLSQELEEKVERRTQLLRDFVSVACHELSAPTNSVRGFAALMLEGKVGPLNGTQTRYLENVARSAERMTRLVGDLSDVSKIEDGRMTLQCEAVDLRLAVEDTVNSFGPLVEDKGLQVEVSLPAKECRVWADRVRVVQILTNLVKNACHYTPAGGHIWVCVQVQQNMAEITVRDTGIGIRREELEHIFERFYRSSDPLVQEQSGTGLGLAIVKSLVELHGGQVWVDSTVGMGSVFGLTLPLMEGTHE